MIKPEGPVKEMLDNFAEKYGGTNAAGNKTSRNTIEIGVRVQPEDNATAQLMEGALNKDRYLHIGKDDVLVLRTDKRLMLSCIEELERSMSEKLGIKVVLIDGITEIVGVVEHGT